MARKDATKCWIRQGGKGGTYKTCAESDAPRARQLRGYKPLPPLPKRKKPKRKGNLNITGVEPSPKRSTAGKRPKRTKPLLIVDDVPAKKAAAKPRTEAQKAASRKSSAAYRARKKAGK